MNTIDKIKELIEEINGCEDVSLESELKLDVGLDSLSMVTLIVGLEEKLNITFDDGDLDPGQIITVKDLVRLVDKTL